MSAGTSTPRRRVRKAAAPDAAAPPRLLDPLGDQRFVLENVSWEEYLAIHNAIAKSAGLKTVYCDGRLTLLTESRKHGWSGERLGQLVIELARGHKMKWEDVGTATFRRRAKKGGVEGDKTFYFGENAAKLKGSKNIDLNSQPPPDLAIEIEVTNSADEAMIVWGRLCVPEVWCLDPIAMECSFWARQRDGTYDEIDQSLAFPMLKPEDVIEQLRLADELGADEWFDGLGRWIRKVILPRKRKGG